MVRRVFVGVLCRERVMMRVFVQRVMAMRIVGPEDVVVARAAGADVREVNQPPGGGRGLLWAVFDGRLRASPGEWGDWLVQRSGVWCSVSAGRFAREFEQVDAKTFVAALGAARADAERLADAMRRHSCSMACNAADASCPQDEALAAHERLVKEESA